MKFVSYRGAESSSPQVGLVNEKGDAVMKVADEAGLPLRSIHHLIQSWDVLKDSITAADSGNWEAAEKLEQVEILAPLRGRDILCVGKNYKDHAAEFHKSGYDSSDTKAQPDFPVIFTKRATSIVGPEHPIYPHPKVTQSLDYEGELGIIVGKSGSQISKDQAWDYVWGATIINDVTARERQRDHKQFYIGKSLDTFCPMGPFAVKMSKEAFNDMSVQTKVNGELRQNARVSDLIFDIPTLIEACSMGITLQEGDVIATGTPAGVALSNGNFLKSGDRVEVSITGLGTLGNSIAADDAPYPKCEPVLVVDIEDEVKRPDTSNVVPTRFGPIYVAVIGSSAPDAPVVTVVHGLGGNAANFAPIITAAGLEQSHRIVLLDLPGHGLSPKPRGDLSIAALADAVAAVLSHLQIAQSAIIAHSMGGLIALTLASKAAHLVTSLVLFGPVMAFGENIRSALRDRASLVLSQGMGAIAAKVATAGVSERTNTSGALSKAFVQSSLLASTAEGYAQACRALAAAEDPVYGNVKVPVLIVAGSEDKTSPAATTDKLAQMLGDAKSITLAETGHWMLVEDVAGSAKALRGAL